VTGAGARACAAALALAVALAASCAPAERAGSPARRVVVHGVELASDGLSREVRIAVPERTRSVTVVVRGATDAYYALAWLETSDGVEHVRLPRAIDVGAAMRASYEIERVGLMPGELTQSIRLGLFTQVFPDRPGRALPPGELTLRIATSDPATPVDLEVLMPEEDGAHRLPLHIVTATDAPDLSRIERALRSVLGGGGVDVDIESVVALPVSSVPAMTEASQPQEPPTSASSQLALLGGTLIAGDSLVVYIVDQLPGGVAGWSLGTPGPPLPDTVYSGVVASRRSPPDEIGRVLAHEIAHYLGVAHIENVGTSGARYPDALDDTMSGGGNLMEGGRSITADQAWVLSRSALLR
jgi:hypothetical protein